MELREFFNRIKECDIDAIRVEQIEEIYKGALPNLAKGIVSTADESLFIENRYRVMSFKEIKYAEEEMHVTFAKERISPVVDCMDNDFIVYDISGEGWIMYNIVDQLKFGELTDLEQLMR